MHRWPVAYYATRTATAHQIYLSFAEVVEALMLFGLIVDYTCMDGASTNRSFTKMAFPETPKSSDFKAFNMFDQEKT